MLLGKLAVSHYKRVGVGGVLLLHVVLKPCFQLGEEAHGGQLLVIHGIDVWIAVVHLEAHLSLLVLTLHVEFLVEFHLGAQRVFHRHIHDAFDVVPVAAHADEPLSWAKFPKQSETVVSHGVDARYKRLFPVEQREGLLPLV